MIASVDPLSSRKLNHIFVDELRRIIPLDHFEPKLHLSGQRVALADSDPTALPLIEVGTLQAMIWLQDGAHRVIPVSYSAGELALSSQIFASSTICFDLLCVSDCMLRWLPRRDIEAALDSHPRLLAALTRFLSQRLREIQMRERTWLERGAREQVWAGLLQAASQIGVTCGAGVRLTLTQEQLAERCALSRSKLSRELRQLEQAGLLKLGRGWIDVLDVAAPLPPYNAPHTPAW